MASIIAPVTSRLNSKSTAGFLLASVALGILVGIATSALAVLINVVESGTSQFQEWTGWGLWAFLALIPAGLLFSWLLNRQAGPGISGGGVSETMVGLSLHGGYLPTKQIIPKIFATAVTLGTGGSGG
ncbi:MAG: hypothetical protein ACC658_14535, partial [Acidimicrobiia bacterium]